MKQLLVFGIVLSLGIVKAQENKFEFTYSDFYGDYLGLDSPDTIPQKFAPEFISNDGETNMCITFSHDGKQIAYTTTDLEFKNFKNMYLRQVNGRWTQPFEMKFSEHKFLINPFFSKNGNRLYFSIAQKNNFQFCYTELSDSTYSELVIFESKYLRAENCFSYAMDDDSTFYFCGKLNDFVGGNTDLYKSYKSGGNIVFENIKHLNTTGDDDSPTLSPDRNFLMYNTIFNPGTDSAVSNIMISKRIDKNEWSQPYNIGEYLQCDHINWGPFVTHDNKYFFYSLQSPSGFDIYWVDKKVIDNYIKH